MKVKAINPSAPKIIKAKSIHGKTLHLRDVVPDDAEFILSLRLDERKSRYLSKTSESITDQKKWIERYLLGDDQAYFIVMYKGECVGTVRLYDPVGDSFCWGSWILNAYSPAHASVESAMIVYAFAFHALGFSRSHFDVRKENEKVRKFHERFGARLLKEDRDDCYYSIDKNDVFDAMQRYRKYLDCDLKIEW